MGDIGLPEKRGFRVASGNANTYKFLNLSMKTYCGLRFESGDGLYGIQPEYLTTSSYLVLLWMSMEPNHSKASKTFASLPSLDPKTTLDSSGR
jgi:hypothetical protein